MESWYRLESVEHYAMILMYTGNIIGKANVLSCDQVQELVKIREKLGIRSGGLPPCCAPQATNAKDIGGGVASPVAGAASVPASKPASTSGDGVSAQEIEPLVREVLSALFPLAHGKSPR
jgi:L-fuculose-phosphate aldolase